MPGPKLSIRHLGEDWELPLQGWLREDPQLSGATVSIERNPVGLFGMAWADVVSVVLPSVLALPGFVDSVLRWVRSGHHDEGRIFIEYGRMRIEITGRDDAVDVAARLAAALQNDPPSP